MSVYFIAVGSEAVKIGHARNPYQRLTQFRPASLESLKLLGFVDGARDVEQRYHDQFAALRIRGELFRLEEPLSALVAGLPLPPASWRVHLQETFRLRLDTLNAGNEIVFDDPRELAATFSDFLQAGAAAERKGVWVVKRGSEGERDYTRRVLMLAKQKYVFRPSGWRRGQKRND